MKKLVRSLLLIPFLVSACAPDSRETGMPATTTAEPQKPTIVDLEGYRVAKGATRIQDMSVLFDKETRSMKVRGKVEYLSLDGRKIESQDLDLNGILDAEGFIELRSHPSLKLKEGLQVAAKATCLSQENTCTSSFIDIYLAINGVVYHHQVESHQDSGEKVTEEDHITDEELESEDESDHADGEPGQYIGSQKEDIDKLLDVKPAPKKEEPKEDPKPEEPKKEEPKPEEPKREEPKREPKPEPKKEEPKREEPKKEDPVRPQPRPSQDPVAKIPKANQAIGSVNLGWLQNAVSLLDLQQKTSDPGFKIIRPERKTHFATNELAYLIQQMGKFTNAEVSGQTLAIGDTSRQSGGKLGRHKSHQNGLDADVAFYFSNGSSQKSFVSAVSGSKPHSQWMPEVSWKLFKSIVGTKLVDRIFIHKALKNELCRLAIQKGELRKGDTTSLPAETLRRLIPDTDHDDHFHVRVKCSSAQVRCRQMAEPATGSGCF
ncbi:penicillin-insensitive murein endopeptidase [Bdellovibrio reynosensis]|uniref:Penicillin-insensitive murein endopeptidase n=1 Tax=Bdellovibrio reynosensis TaxID=2835041 RepID=A0ABY4CG03_9BACT|nr:penicillin-insensitive murein endopeptidase [Bdellovibrio reynosensis]UOF02807.1 penicillin-insensitive murein endopeptidase [Bdellovibrio reynosensis]